MNENSPPGRWRDSIRDINLHTVRGRGRSHRFVRGLLTVSLNVVIAIGLAVVAYTAPFLRTERTDLINLVVACILLALVPPAIALVMMFFRRNESPIVVGVLLSTVIFSFAVTILSAARVPVSYVGLALALPAIIVPMVHANLRLGRVRAGRVAVLNFVKVDRVKRALGADITVVNSTNGDLTAIDTLLIDPYHHHTPEWSALLARCYLSGVEIEPWYRFLEMRDSRVELAEFDISDVSYAPSQAFYARTKRFFDLCFIVVTLPLTLLISALVAAIVLIVDGGPVLFVQHRLGYGGRVFRLYKFRTMYKGTSAGATQQADARILPGCRLIRKFRIDELPQLYNILRGEMSLIGPRPEALDLAKWYHREIPEYPYRLLVLPGLSGWAQVCYGYTSNPDEARRKLSYDLYYLKHLSFDLDLLILFKTVRTVLFGAGAR